jgi:hypothetical protein
MMMAVAGLVLAVSPLVSTQTHVSVQSEVNGQISSAHGIVWSAARPLAWSDFKAAAPADVSEGALTGYSLFYGMRCTGRAFEFVVSAVFLPDQSWVRPVVLADPHLKSATLDHEQTHFDISEVFARRMRKYFAELNRPCTRPDDELKKSADQIVHDESDEQARYDRETRHGLSANAQQAWDHDVQNRLATYGSFAH